MGNEDFGLPPERADLLRNPNYYKARAAWHALGLGEPRSWDMPLVWVHKARLMWPGSSVMMIYESQQWLLNRGYDINYLPDNQLVPQGASDELYIGDNRDDLSRPGHGS